MQQRIEFFVEDRPRPGGSKRAFLPKGSLRPIVVEDNKHTKTWRNSVRHAARSYYDGEPLEGAVWMGVRFLFRRPKSHYGTGRNARRLKPSAPPHHIQTPDLTKLVRSTEDALKGITWHDDSQVAARRASKRWVDRWDREGAMIAIAPAAENAEAAE